MNISFAFLALALNLLGAAPSLATNSAPLVSPVGEVNEIDVDYLGSGVLYFTRIFPNGSASLALASQNIGGCPANTFDFKALYNQLSALPKSPIIRSQFAWEWGATNKHGPIGGAIEDPKIVLGILMKFVGSGKNQTLLERFSDYPALPPIETALLLQAGKKKP